MPFSVILAFVFTLFITVFAVLNSAQVIIKVPFLGQFSISQAVVIIGSAAVGALIVLVFSLIKQVKLNLKINKQSKKIRELKSQIDSLESQKKKEEDKNDDTNLKNSN